MYVWSICLMCYQIIKLEAMILYNVTVSIDATVRDEWLMWMRSKHIPEVMETGCFTECRISKVHGEEEGGYTYAIAYVCPNEDMFNEYRDKHASALQKEHKERYEGKFAAFRTMLSIIDEFRS